MTQPAKHARTESLIVFPAPIPYGINPDGPIKPDYSALVSSVFETNGMPSWCGVLVCRGLETDRSLHRSGSGSQDR